MFRSLRARRWFFRLWPTQTPTKRGSILRLLSDWTNTRRKGSVLSGAPPRVGHRRDGLNSPSNQSEWDRFRRRHAGDGHRERRV